MHARVRACACGTLSLVVRVCVPVCMHTQVEEMLANKEEYQAQLPPEGKKLFALIERIFEQESTRMIARIRMRVSACAYQQSRRAHL